MGLFSSGRGRPRLCRACGNLVGAEADDCSYCGAKDRLTTGLLQNPTRLFGKLGPSRSFAVFILVYFAVMVVADRVFLAPGESEEGASVLGGFGYSYRTFLGFGGLLPELVRRGEYWRFVTPIFIHLGLIHLAFNTYAFFFLGPLIEELFGKSKLVVVFLFSGIVAAIAMFLFGQGGAGASGGIFGFIGALVAYGVRLPTRFGQAVKVQAIQWAAWGLIVSLFIGASNTAHVAGLVSGFAAAYFLGPDDPSTERARKAVGSLVWFFLGVTVLALALMAAQLPRFYA